MRQDIRSFRYELLNVLKMNDFKTPNLKDQGGAIGKKSKNLVCNNANFRISFEFWAV